jgi:deazaflavin-dependent oxidoreductase (nitroreductase family)
MSEMMQKQLFRLTMAIHIFLYRLTGGRFGGEMRGFKVLLLTTTGRKSGQKRTTPLGYFDYDGGYVIAASNAGLPRNPGWYYNLMNNHRATVEVKDREIMVVPEEATGNLRNQLWEQLIKQAPSYAEYPKQTTREIPVVILRPE